MVKMYFRGTSSIPAHQTRGMKGGGAGAVLLDGGKGGQSSYSSLEEYTATTGRNPMTAPKGMGLMNSAALQSLVIKKPAGKKPKNINFCL
jgi:hypothetical protein